MSSQYSMRVFLGLGLLLVGVIGVFGLVRYAQNQSLSGTGSSQEQQVDLPAGVYAAYASNDAAGSKEVQVKLYNLATQEQRSIASFPLGDSVGGDNLQFTQYADAILVGRDESNTLLALAGRTRSDFIDPGFLPFVFSADQKKLAYLRDDDAVVAATGKNMVDFQLVLKDVTGAQEKSVGAGSETVEPGLLTPLIWSADGKFLYADHRRSTEGYPKDLVRINTETLAVEPITAVKTDGLQYVPVDAHDHAYTVGKTDGSAGFVQTAMNSGETQQFSIPEGLDHLVSVSPDGRFVAFDSVPDGSDFSAVSIYDIEKQVSFPITKIGAKLDSGLFWQDSHLMFTETVSGDAEIGRDDKRSYAVVLYDLETHAGKQLTFTDTSVLRPIGFFEVAEGK